jgi:alkylation response protein AidB-like acyl-CoA dehydrogenase
MQGGCMVREGEQPRLLPGGGPDVHLLIWPRADLEVVDTWDVAGLRGTGSHDMVVKDLAVPAERAISLFSTPRTEPGPLYAFPVFGLLAAGISAVALGAARAALDDLIELAGGKTPNMSRRVLAQHGHAQATTARAEARRRAARGFLLEAIDTAWEEAETGGELSVPARANLRLAATHAMAEAAAVVDAVYTLAGGTAIYAASPLQRRFRDVHVATQHMMVGPATWELAGKVVLGLDVDPAMI